MFSDQPARLAAARRQAERRARHWAMVAIPLVTASYALVTLDTEHYASRAWSTQSSAVFILCAALIPLVCEAAQRVFDPLNPRNLFLLTIALQFGFYPVFILHGGERTPVFDYASGSGIDAHYVGTELLAALGLVCYLLGYSSCMSRHLEWLLPRPRPLDPRRIKVICVFLFVAGYLGAFAIFHNEGGLSQFLENREQWRAGGMSGSGIFLMPASMWLPAAALLPMMLLTSYQQSKRRLAATLGFLSVCLIPVYLLGFRSLIVTPLMQCLAIFHYLRHRISVARYAAVGLIIAGLMTLYGLNRGEAALDVAAVEAAGPQATLEYVFFRTPGSDTVATILNSVKPTDFDYGMAGVSEAATILVPHLLWHDKPLSWGERFSTRFFADYLYMSGNIKETYGGMSSTAIGFFYLQFGWSSVALGMFLIGVASKTIYFYGLRFAGGNTAFLLFILLWPIQIVAAEAPQNALNDLVITVFCVWLPLSYLGAKKRREVFLPCRAMVDGCSAE
jgi:hypothetical protein